MKIRLALPFVLTGLVAAYPFLAPVAGPPQPIEAVPYDDFAPVFAIMNQQHDFQTMGCRGCHIGEAPAVGPWWGNDQDTVLQTLETGVNPDGRMLDPIPVVDGRNGLLGFYLHRGIMPVQGALWTTRELFSLDLWLKKYEN